MILFYHRNLPSQEITNKSVVRAFFFNFEQLFECIKKDKTLRVGLMYVLPMLQKSHPEINAGFIMHI